MTRPLALLGFEYRDGAYYRIEGDTDMPFGPRPISNMSFAYRIVPIDTPSSAIIVPIDTPSSAIIVRQLSYGTHPDAFVPISSPSAAPIDRAYTDQTIRLNAHCRECSDVLPVDAQFCISCGAPVC